MIRMMIEQQETGSHDAPYQEVPHEPGYGHFRMEYSIDEKLKVEIVPPVELDRQTDLVKGSDIYLKSTFPDGTLIAAMRLGPRGICVIMVNPDKVEITSASIYRFIHDPSSYNHLVLIEEKIPPEKFYTGNVSDGIVYHGESDRVEYHGIMKQSGEQFKAKLEFVRTPGYVHGKKVSDAD